MNHSSPGSLALRKAIIGFSNYKTAEGLTVRSVDSYKQVLDQWADHLGEIDVGSMVSGIWSPGYTLFEPKSCVDANAGLGS